MNDPGGADGPKKRPAAEGPRARSAGPRRRPTINDIARLANVSKKTVSRVINNSPFVREDTRVRINAIIAEHGFAPDPQARGLSLRRSFLIGMIYDNPNPQYVVNMQQGLLDGMRGSGFELVVHPCDRKNPSFIDDIRNFVERQKLYGVVLSPSVSEDDAVAAALDEVGCAYVRIASVPLDAPDRMIVSHDRIGGREAARHLIGLGHRRLAFISGPPSFRSAHERRGGFQDGMAEAGLILWPEHIAMGAYTFESGLACGELLLALDPRPTGIFAGNDEMAAGLLQAARRAGLEVPRDLSIVGFDDFQLASSVWPALTTIHTQTREAGRLAALKLIGGGGPERGPERETPSILPHLVVRDSTGPAPA